MRPRTSLTALLSCLVLGAPAIGVAHAYLVKSAPARRAVLFQAPDRVQLWFNERLEPHFCQLSVWDRDGNRVDLGDVRVGPEDAAKLSIGIPPLLPGIYTVKFRILSVDGHIVESQFPFTLRGNQ